MNTLRHLFLIFVLLPGPGGSLVVAAEGGFELFGERLGLGGNEPQFLPVEEAFRVIATPGEDRELVLDWQIAEGYYLYRDKFSFALAGAAPLNPPQLPLTEVKADPYFGDVEIIKGDFSTRLRFAASSPASTALELKYQGCAEDGICYPPVTQTLAVEFPDDTAVASAPIAGSPALSESDSITAALSGKSALAVLGSFFVFGLLLSFTPCILPMIPILSGIIVGEGTGLSARRGLVLSLIYTLSMAAMYAIAGVFAGLFGQNLQAFMQHPAVITGFAGFFVILAISMFGAFEFQMPSVLQSRFSDMANRQSGAHLGGVALMGALSAVIVGPCVAPPLAGALLYIAQTGDALLGGAALFVLALGMGVPLIAVGASAGHWLPKAGVWMENVKRAFGLILLGVALWLLERIIAGPVALGLWGLLLLVSAMFLNPFKRFDEVSGSWGRVSSGLGIAMLAYGIAAVIGAAAGGAQLGKPLAPFTGGSFAASGALHGLAFRRIKAPNDLAAELQRAGSTKQISMLDFYADWCIECKHMERETFVDAGVQQSLAGLHVLQADVTANDELDQALLKQHELFGPPAILFFGPDGKELRQLRLVGFFGPEEFTQHLQRVRAVSP